MPNITSFQIDLTPAEAEQLRAARRAAKFRYTVGPFWRVQGESRTFGPGEEITLADLPRYVDRSPESTMSELVRSSHVIHLTDEELEAARCPADARYVVAPDRGVASRSRGVLAPGAAVSATDFDAVEAKGELRIMSLVASGYVVDRGAQGVQA